MVHTNLSSLVLLDQRRRRFLYIRFALELTLSMHFPSFGLTKKKLSTTGGTYWSFILQQST